jgi:hypothetical protein
MEPYNGSRFNCVIAAKNTYVRVSKIELNFSAKVLRRSKYWDESIFVWLDQSQATAPVYRNISIHLNKIHQLLERNVHHLSQMEVKLLLAGGRASVNSLSAQWPIPHYRTEFAGSISREYKYLLQKIKSVTAKKIVAERIPMSNRMARIVEKAGRLLSVALVSDFARSTFVLNKAVKPTFRKVESANGSPLSLVTSRLLPVNNDSLQSVFKTKLFNCNADNWVFNRWNGKINGGEQHVRSVQTSRFTHSVGRLLLVEEPARNVAVEPLAVIAKAIMNVFSSGKDGVVNLAVEPNHSSSMVNSNMHQNQSWGVLGGKLLIRLGNGSGSVVLPNDKRWQNKASNFQKMSSPNNTVKENYLGSLLIAKKINKTLKINYLYGPNTALIQDRKILRVGQKKGGVSSIFRNGPTTGYIADQYYTRSIMNSNVATDSVALAGDNGVFKTSGTTPLVQYKDSKRVKITYKQEQIDSSQADISTYLKKVEHKLRSEITNEITSGRKHQQRIQDLAVQAVLLPRSVQKLSDHILKNLQKKLRLSDTVRDTLNA